MTLKSRREKIEELRELGRVFEECKLELEELENSLKETDEAISKKLESTLQPPPVFLNPQSTPLPQSIPLIVAKETNKSDSNASLPNLTIQSPKDVLTGSLTYSPA